jgi:hypothetical protein
VWEIVINVMREEKIVQVDDNIVSFINQKIQIRIINIGPWKGLWLIKP